MLSLLTDPPVTHRRGWPRFDAGGGNEIREKPKEGDRRCAI